MARLLIVASLFFTFAMAAPAQNGGLKSGPAVGQVLPGPFHPFNVNGVHTDRPHCLVCQHGLNTAVAIFVRGPLEPGKPLADLLKKLDALVEQRADASLGVYVIVLSDAYPDYDQTRKLAQALRDGIKALELKQITVAIETAAGPEGYNLNPEADVTVLVYRQQKVEANFAFGKDGMTEKDVAAVLDATQKVLPPKRKRR